MRIMSKQIRLRGEDFICIIIMFLVFHTDHADFKFFFIDGTYGLTSRIISSNESKIM